MTFKKHIVQILLYAIVANNFLFIFNAALTDTEPLCRMIANNRNID